MTAKVGEKIPKKHYKNQLLLYFMYCRYGTDFTITGCNSAGNPWHANTKTSKSQLFRIP
jgi:hypothetical protein